MYNELTDVRSDLQQLENTIDEVEDSVSSYTLVASGNSIDITHYAGSNIAKAESVVASASADTDVELYCCGKNHIMPVPETGGKNAFAWERKADGSIVLNGTADRQHTIPLGTVLCVYNTKWRCSIQRSATNDNVYLFFNGLRKDDTFTQNKHTTPYAKKVSILVANGAVCDNLVIRPMIEFGEYDETVTYEGFYGFVKTYTTTEAITDETIEWGKLSIPNNATTLWMYNSADSVNVYDKLDIKEVIHDVNDRMDNYDAEIEGAYAHQWVVDVEGWDDASVTYESGFINASGDVTSNNIFRHSNYISCLPGDRVEYNLYGYSSQVYIVTFYNSQKTRLSGIVGQSSYKSGTINAPDDTAYVRFSTQNSATGTFSVSHEAKVTGDTTVANLKSYADQKVSIASENVVLTRGDVPVISGEIYSNIGIYSLGAGMRTDYIPVSPGDTINYRVYNYIGSSVKQNAVTCFGADKTVVDYVRAESSGWTSGVYTVPANGAYVIVSWQFGLLYEGWFSMSVASYSDELANIVGRMQTIPESPLKGKQWCLMGDSITYGANTTKTYFNYISERCGITAYNFGQSNTAIAKKNDDTTNAMVTRYTGMYDDVDYVTVFGGTNDHGQQITIGQWGDAQDTTLYGAMKILVEGLIAKYTGKKIGFILPLPKYGQTGGVYYDYSYPSASFYPYIQCIKDVCMRYSIPTLDLYTESGISPSIEAVRTAMIPDGLHPNAVGHEFISRKIQKFLESL